MKNIFITLDNLKTFLSELKVFIKDYFDSRIDTALSTTSMNPVANKVVTEKFNKVVWQGTSEELEIAIAAGKVDENTVIILTDDDDQPYFVECTYQEIYNIVYPTVA